MQFVGERRGQSRKVAALEVRELHDVARYDLLDVGWQPVPHVEVGEEPPAAPGVVRKVERLLDFVQAALVDVDQRVLLRFDDMRLERGVELADVDRRGRRSQRTEEIDEERTRGDANLQTVEIGRAPDRLVGRDFAESVIPGVWKSVNS